MEEEKNENLDSQNEDTDQADNLEDTDSDDTGDDTGDDTDDVEALKEKNRQLFARAKKAEGFILKDGQWVKKEKPQSKPEPKAPQSQPETPNVKTLLEEEFEKRDLEVLDLPEELKTEVQKLAKLQNISVRKAAADPYILHRKQEIEQQEKVDNAAISRKKKGATVQFDTETPPEVDLTTPEGRETWNKYKEFLKKQA